MTIEVIPKSILEADDQYIVHQLNSVTSYAAGLANAMFKKFPHSDVYSHRKNPHYPENSELPGNIIVRGNGEDERYVIGIYGQYYPGKPKYSNSTRDGIETRARAFQLGLDKIVEIVDLGSIGFPKGIGCTLAGGDWSRYSQMIENFAEKLNNTKVILYDYS